MDASQTALALLAVLLAVIPIVVFSRSRPRIAAKNPPFTREDAARALEAHLTPLGFTRQGHTFARERPEFFDRISIETLANGEEEDDPEDKDAGAGDDGGSINDDRTAAIQIGVALGVQPKWSAETTAPRDTENCEIRHFVEAEEAPEGWWNCDGEEAARVEDIVRSVAHHAGSFFGHFSSIEASFGAIDIYEIDQGQLPQWFEATTRIRMALFAARAHARAGRAESALALARHGLRTAGPAVALKAEFKAIIEGAERAIKAAWESAPKAGRPDLAAALNLEPGERYLPLPIPAPRDEALIRLMRGASAPALEDAVRPEHARVLLAFSERAATLAVRRKDATLLAAGFKALTLAADVDTRDAMTVLPLYYDAALRLETDPAILFATAVVSAAKDGVAASLRSFVNRSPEDRSLEAMGYVASADSDGFRYERTW